MKLVSIYLLFVLCSTAQPASDEKIAEVFRVFNLESAIQGRVGRLDHELLFPQDWLLKEKLERLNAALFQSHAADEKALSLLLSRALSERARYRAIRAKIIRDHFSVEAVRARLISWLKSSTDASLQVLIDAAKDPRCLTGPATVYLQLVNHPFSEIAESVQLQLPEVQKWEPPASKQPPSPGRRMDKGSLP